MLSKIRFTLMPLYCSKNEGNDNEAGVDCSELVYRYATGKCGSAGEEG